MAFFYPKLRTLLYTIQDYDKPMGITTYKSLSEMPEDMQKVLPDLDDIKKIM